MSQSSEDFQGSSAGPQTPSEPQTHLECNTTSSLEDLQTEEQRRILDTVAKIRKCGLDSILSLPQLVVCGDQSAGKSSVLEALTEIPFPRNDNLCTRFATEIILRHDQASSITIKVIPDSTRPQAEQEALKAFNESITNFGELPKIMDLAMAAMGISNQAQAFSRDVLSIEVEGPSQPQLTLVDIPGLIQTSTKGVSDADVELVAEITNHYISQPRTICLAVVSATNDAANQPILRKVRLVDPKGDRTLGIITKPDRLPPGSGSESKFLELARNEDVFFKLGWHVLKNRKFEEAAHSLMERNASEAAWFRQSNFNSLPSENLGIDTLRSRLSSLLFEHVKEELPRLRQDLESALSNARSQLELLGDRRSAAAECKAYLTQLSMAYHETCKAAVKGYYEDDYFYDDADQPFSLESPATIARLRAVVQYMNTEFCKTFRTKGHKYQIDMLDTGTIGPLKSMVDASGGPIKISQAQAIQWIRQGMLKNRGQELQGNFNPLIIGELFESSPPIGSALRQITSKMLHKFDVKARVWSSRILDALRARRKAAIQQLELIIEDTRSFPINYNHYYTDTIHKLRQERQKTLLKDSLESATTHSRMADCNSTHMFPSIDVNQVVASFSTGVDPDMENFSCEEALDCLFAIYKVSQKTFIANITTQVIERHIVRGLENIFSPVVVNGLSDGEVEAIASEPASTRRQREFLEDRISKLEEGHEIFRGVMGSATR